MPGHFSLYYWPLACSLITPPFPGQFTPSAGPVDGGTTLTIEGLNLGAERGHLNYVTVGEADCAITEYIPGVMWESCDNNLRNSVVYSTIMYAISIAISQSLINPLIPHPLRSTHTHPHTHAHTYTGCGVLLAVWTVVPTLHVSALDSVCLGVN